MGLLIALQRSGMAQIQSEWQLARRLFGGYRDAARRMAHAEEATATPALRLKGIHREGCITAAAWMHHMILTASQRPFHPRVPQVERQRGMHTDGRMQRIRWLPGAIADAGDKLAGASRRPQRHAPAVAGD